MPSSPPVRDRVVDEMELLIGRLARRRGVRHVSVGAAPLDGSWVSTDATGSADSAARPMRPETPWLIASITKLHIAAVILRLHEEGRLDLDAPVAEHVPAELGRGLHVRRGVDHTSALTATHLLGHLSGLPDHLDEKPAGGASLIDEILRGPDRRWTAEDAVRRARDELRPHFPPSDPQGTRPRIRYSDTNYQLLVVLAEQVTGRSMPELYSELLFEPLQLSDTWLPGQRPDDPIVPPAVVWLGDRAFDDRPGALESFGDLYSTTEDLLRFGRSLFRGEVFDDPATGRLMVQRFNRFGLPRSLATIRSPSWPIEYGLGIMRFAPSRLLSGGRRVPHVIGHTGSTGSWLWFVPDLGLVVAGTVDQASAAAVPFQAVPRALAALRR